MFKIRHDHFHHSDPDTRRHLDQVLQALNLLIQRTNRMALNFERLETEISETSSAIDGAVTLLQQVAQEIRDNADNQRKITALADQLDAKAQALAEAVAANTPAAPTE